MAYRRVTRKADLESAVSDAYSQMQSLRDEVQEIVDNASGTNLENTGRIQTLSETASTLDSSVDYEPTIPEVVGELVIAYTEMVNMNKRRGPSRAARRDNACSILAAACQACENWLNEKANENHERRDEVEALMNELDNHMSEFDSVEFPGMMG